MGEDHKPKSQGQTETINITVDEFGSSVPGVTQLINPKAFKDREFARSKTASPAQVSAEPPPSTASEPSPTSAGEISILFDGGAATQSQIKRPKKKTALTRFGVLFELQFEDQMGSMVFTRALTHADETFDEWHRELFSKMKIDLRTLEINVSFQEFSAEKNLFHKDAFALPDGGFLQFVRSRENSAVMFVLISTKSLILSKEEIYRALEGNFSSGSSSGEDGISIEIAS